jgi:hypothetical protein
MRDQQKQIRMAEESRNLIQMKNDLILVSDSIKKEASNLYAYRDRLIKF